MIKYRQVFKKHIKIRIVECRNMKLESRVQNIAYLLIGLLFIIVGLALNEFDIITNVHNASLEDWYHFLMPWVGDTGNGLPTPW